MNHSILAASVLFAVVISGCSNTPEEEGLPTAEALAITCKDWLALYTTPLQEGMTDNQKAIARTLLRHHGMPTGTTEMRAFSVTAGFTCIDGAPPGTLDDLIIWPDEKR